MWFSFSIGVLASTAIMLNHAAKIKENPLRKIYIIDTIEK